MPHSVVGNIAFLATEDGRHFEKSTNRHISATIRPIATTFGEMTDVASLNYVSLYTALA